MKQIFLYLLVLCTVVARAQKNYVPAIVISQQNDSLRGFIDYRNWRISPEQVSFKQDLSAQEQHFKASDISGFLILPENELYLSRQVQLDITLQTIDNLMSTSERTYRDDTVFLLNIVKGTYNLYVFTDKNDQAHYVYDSEGQGAKELRLIKKVAAENSSAIATIKLYQQQLAFLFADCPDIAKRSEKVNYSENSLRSFFADYHQCKHPSDVIAVKAKEKLGIKWGLLAGVSNNSYKFSGDHFLASGVYKSNVSPLMGLFINIPLSRSRQQYWCGLEAFYKKVDASGTFETWNIIRPYQEQVNLKFSYAQMNLVFRYVYPAGTIRPFANLGLGYAFMLSESSNERYPVGKKEDAKEAIDGPRKYEASIFGGVGLQYNRLQLEARYASSNGFSPYVTLGTGIRSLQGIVRFAF